jgi:PhzF family phenazine biosynthesis protein
MAKKKSTTRSAPKPAKREAAKAPAARPIPVPARITLPIYHIDAFTARPLHGNPAAVVLLDKKWLDDEMMQAIAAETNQPMTAFVLRGKGKSYGLRWFNHQQEFDLCGHATLAAAHVLFSHEKAKGASLTFSTAAGALAVHHDDDLYVLAMQARPPVRVRITNDLCAALGREPVEAHMSGDMLAAVFDNKRAVHELTPDFARLAKLGPAGIIATAPAAGHDFVSRYFAPRHGLNEDHATGSSHCVLVPYWAKRLNKSHLFAHQVSHRGGEMWCELRGDRVLLGGHAVTLGQGTLRV